MSDINISVTGKKRLKTAGKYCADDIVVTATGGGGGVAPNLQPKTVTPAKYEQKIEADSGYDGLSTVIVKTIPAQYIEPTGTMDIKKNGTYDVTAAKYASVNVPIPEGYIKPSGVKDITENGTEDVTSYEQVNVNVKPKLQEKNANENGEVTPDEGYDGLSKVIVNVASSGGGENKLAKVVDGTITEITAEDLQGATKIKKYSFDNCAELTSAIIPNGVTIIELYAFFHCEKMESITIPDGVTEIGNSAFRACSKLKSIIIPGSVSKIGSDSFGYCSELQYLDFTNHTSVPTLGNVGAISGLPKTFQIRVPMALVDEWKAATNWSTYASQIVGVSNNVSINLILPNGYIFSVDDIDANFTWLDFINSDQNLVVFDNDGSDYGKIKHFSVVKAPTSGLDDDDGTRIVFTDSELNSYLITEGPNGTPKLNEKVEGFDYGCTGANDSEAPYGIIAITDYNCPTDPETYIFIFKLGITWGDFIGSEYNNTLGGQKFEEGMEADMGVYEVAFNCSADIYTTDYYTNNEMTGNIILEF